MNDLEKQRAEDNNEPSGATIVWLFVALLLGGGVLIVGVLYAFFSTGGRLP